jgi:hypothetical protein
MGVNFCSSCGSALAVTSTDTTMSVQPVEDISEGVDDATAVGLLELPRGIGMLVVKRGPNTGIRYALESEVTRAGRHPESDIFLDDITVSRRHAEFITHDHVSSVRERHLREPGTHRRGATVQRRRGTDRQVQTAVFGGYRRMTEIVRAPERGRAR